MWIYEKKLQYPVNIRNGDLRMAKWLITQYGGPYSNRIQLFEAKSFFWHSRYKPSILIAVIHYIK